MAKIEGWNSIDGCIELYKAGNKAEAFKRIAKMNIRKVPKKDMQAIGLGYEVIVGTNLAFYKQLGVDPVKAAAKAEELFIKYFITEKE